ncbi:hypothetical protein BKA93DRAFT_746522 [Sparassis latifolia]
MHWFSVAAVALLLITICASRVGFYYNHFERPTGHLDLSLRNLAEALSHKERFLHTSEIVIDGFHNCATALLDGEDIEHLEISSNEVADEESWTMEDVEENSEDIEEKVLPENITLLLPSSLGIDQCKAVGWKSIAQQELHLQVGQANNCLEDLRLLLSHKSLLFQTKFRHNKSQWHKTRNAAKLRRIDQQESKIIR